MKVNEKDEYIIRQKTNSERREIRSILYFFLNRNENDIPTDYNFMENLDYIIISKLEYCIFRVSKKGILEREMIEEVKNIAILLEECFFLDYERKNEKMYINIFEYLLSFKNIKNKEIISELFEKSEILYILNVIISQYSSTTFSYKLISDFTNSLNISRKNIIDIMTFQICPGYTKEKLLDIRTANAHEIFYGIQTGYFNKNDEQVYLRLKRLCEESNEFDYIVNNHDIPICVVLDLIIMKYLRDDFFYEILKDNLFYRMYKEPWKVDYSSIPVKYLVNVKCREIINNAKEYGGYDLYRKIYEEVFLKDNKSMCIRGINAIITDDVLRREYMEKNNLY